MQARPVASLRYVLELASVLQPTLFESRAVNDGLDATLWGTWAEAGRRRGSTRRRPSPYAKWSQTVGAA
jgi:hypothetical protein